MDGENNGKPYVLMDDLGGKPTIFGNIHMDPSAWKKKSIHLHTPWWWLFTSVYCYWEADFRNR